MNGSTTSHVILRHSFIFYAVNAPDVDRVSERRDMEPFEVALPVEEREGAAGQEPHGEGRPHHREAELSALRHDHAPSHRRIDQEQAHQEGACRIGIEFLLVLNF